MIKFFVNSRKNLLFKIINNEKPVAYLVDLLTALICFLSFGHFEEE